MDLQNLYDTAKPALIAVGLKVLGAIASLAGTLIQIGAAGYPAAEAHHFVRQRAA